MKTHPFAFLALLLACFFGTGCMAARPIDLEIKRAPMYPIKGHAGVAVFPVETHNSVMYDGRQQLANKITGDIREALSFDESGFKLVEGQALDKINEYLQKSASRYDNIDQSFINQFESNFGTEVPATGWFMGTITMATTTGGEVERRLKVIDAVANLLAGTKKEPEYEMVRSGEAVLGCEIRFVNLGSKVIQSKNIQYSIPAESAAVPDGMIPPMINFNGAFLRAADKIIDDFKKFWTISVVKTQVQIFVHDGTFAMPWEPKYPNLDQGFQRMQNKDYAFAAEEYTKAVEKFRPAGGEMLARSLYDLAVATEAQGELDAALPLYNEARRISTNKAISDGYKRCEDAIENRRKLQEIEDARIKAQPTP